MLNRKKEKKKSSSLSEKASKHNLHVFIDRRPGTLGRRRAGSGVRASGHAGEERPQPGPVLYVLGEHGEGGEVVRVRLHVLPVGRGSLVGECGHGHGYGCAVDAIQRCQRGGQQVAAAGAPDARRRHVCVAGGVSTRYARGKNLGAGESGRVGGTNEEPQEDSLAGARGNTVVVCHRLSTRRL
jgi:hypothetical protein